MLLYSLSLGGGFINTACSTDRKPGNKEISVDNSFVSLKNELNKYSVSVLVNYPSTRSDNNNFNDIITADSIGALLGAAATGDPILTVVTGAFFSIFKGISILKKSLSSTYDTSGSGGGGGDQLTFSIDYGLEYHWSFKDVNPQDINLNSEDISYFVGYYHNSIIRKLYIENPDLLTMSVNDVKALILSEVDSVFQDSLSCDIKNEVDFICDLGEISKELLYARYPELLLEFDIIEMYCNVLANISDSENAIEYTSGYISIIQDSEIPADTKTSIITGISTGLHSSLLWEIE